MPFLILMSWNPVSLTRYSKAQNKGIDYEEAYFYRILLRREDQGEKWIDANSGKVDNILVQAKKQVRVDSWKQERKEDLEKEDGESSHCQQVKMQDLNVFLIHIPYFNQLPNSKYRTLLQNKCRMNWKMSSRHDARLFTVTYRQNSLLMDMISPNESTKVSIANWLQKVLCVRLPPKQNQTRRYWENS